MTYNSINNLTTNNNSSFNTDTPSEESIRSLDGRLWRCISKTENPLGGFLYRFKPREDITDFREENFKSYPAIELLPEKASTLTVHPLNKLGFDWNGQELQLPDPTAVQQLWKKLRDEEKEKGWPTPNFNPTIIWSFNDTETDDDFIKYFLSNQIVISRGKEFLHDMTDHLAPTLQYMYSFRSKYALRRPMILACQSIYEQIQHAKKTIQENPNITDLTNDDITKLTFTLAWAIDTLIDIDSASSNKTAILNVMQTVWNFNKTSIENDGQTQALYNYIHNRFGNAYFTGKSFSEIWEKVMQLNGSVQQ
jgi:hypothetical protein